MEEKITKGELTLLAKRICKVNREALYLLTDAEELVKNETVQHLMRMRKNGCAEWEQLNEKVQKYAEDDACADIIRYGACLDELADLLSAVWPWEDDQ